MKCFLASVVVQQSRESASPAIHSHRLAFSITGEAEAETHMEI
jgi:hypothetical protein